MMVPMIGAINIMPAPNPVIRVIARRDRCSVQPVSALKNSCVASIAWPDVTEPAQPRRANPNQRPPNANAASAAASGSTLPMIIIAPMRTGETTDPTTTPEATSRPRFRTASGIIIGQSTASRIRGSSASRIPSPRRLNPKTVSARNNPGKNDHHQTPVSNP